MDGQHSWAVSVRSRTSSISGLNSIGQVIIIIIISILEPCFPLPRFGQHSWAVNIYNIVGRTWMAGIPGLSLRDQEPPAYPVSIVLARLVSL